MARDYAKKSKPQKAASRGTSSKKQGTVMGHKSTVPVLWMIAGLFIGLFFSGLIFLKEHHVKTFKDKVIKVVKESVQKIEKKPSGPKEPRFDFYTILPKEKVWLPKSAEKPIAASKEPEAPVAYILQVASFKHSADADKLKTKLIAEGYSVKVKKSQKNNWNRVWLGPFKSEQKVQTIQVKVAQSNGLNGLIIKIDE